MPDPGPVTTYSSHRNLATSPRSWNPPHLVINPKSLPDFPCLSPSRRKHALSHKKLVHVVSCDVRDPIRPLKQELGSHKCLEFVGDSFLRFCIQRILATRYTDMTASCIDGISTQLLSNATLSWIAWYYGLFDDEILQQTNTVSTFVYNSQKPAADLFEAWLGALSQERPLEELVGWISDIFSDAVFPGLDKLVRDARTKEFTRIGNRKVNISRIAYGVEPGQRRTKRRKIDSDNPPPLGFMFDV